MSRKILAFDMDGVLVDLNAQLAWQDGYDCSLNWFHDMYDSSKYKHVGEFYYEKIQKNLHRDFFKYMPAMSNIKALYKMMSEHTVNGWKVIILSSATDDDAMHDTIAHGKREWVKSMITTTIDEVVITRSQHEKADYAKKLLDSGEASVFIMVDDMNITYDAFTEKGIPCVKHTSVLSTIKKIRDLTSVKSGIVMY